MRLALLGAKDVKGFDIKKHQAHKQKFNQEWKPKVNREAGESSSSGSEDEEEGEAEQEEIKEDVKEEEIKLEVEEQKSEATIDDELDVDIVGNLDDKIEDIDIDAILDDPDAEDDEEQAEQDDKDIQQILKDEDITLVPES